MTQSKGETNRCLLTTDDEVSSKSVDIDDTSRRVTGPEHNDIDIQAGKKVETPMSDVLIASTSGVSQHNFQNGHAKKPKEGRDNDGEKFDTNEKNINKEIVKSKRRRFHFFGTISLLTLIVSAVSLGIVISSFVTEINADSLNKENGIPTSPFPEVCIDCLKIVKNPYQPTDSDELLDGLMKKYENGVLKCCAKDYNQISAILEAMLREQTRYTDELDLDSPSVSAHKLMKSDMDISRNGEINHIYMMFDPKNISALTEHVRGIKITESGFIVQFNGIYFIYSNVHLESGVARHQTWYSYIHRTRPNSGAGTGVLLKTAHTQCDSCKNGTRETVFTGGVFLLKAGDFIQVTVRERGLVDFRKDSSYLGLVMMGYK